jgi:hypothetical protein
VDGHLGVEAAVTSRWPALAGALLLGVMGSLGGCGDDDDGGDGAGGLPREGVAVTIDGEDIELDEVCSGHGGDEAVVAVTDTGRLVILLQEDEDALMLSTEGENFADTDDVERTTVDGATRYAGTVTVQGEPTKVTMVVDDDAEDDLERC